MLEDTITPEHEQNMTIELSSMVVPDYGLESFQTITKREEAQHQADLAELKETELRVLGNPGI